MLGLADSLCRGTAGYGSPLYFATVERGGDVAGCAFRTPPYKLGLTRMPVEAAPALAADVGDVYGELPAVLGPVAEARAFGEAWAALRGVRPVTGARQRIHALDRVRFPRRQAAGHMRLAAADDVPLVTVWVKDFLRATELTEAGDPDVLVDRVVAGGFLALWVDGTPVSMAGFPAHTRNTVRIGYVFTPREDRRRGYATALVAHVSRHILDSGFRRCVLYTDLANPTANSIYRTVGYVPVQDVMDVLFEMPDAVSRAP